MPTNNWIRFLRNYGPIPTNDNMYDETIQRALARLKMPPIELPAQHLAWLVDNFRSCCLALNNDNAMQTISICCVST
ncbi:hypothetical protein GA830_19890 (plasmid) [Mesorhizobium sp. NBSH29]|nr:hypothetical protein GA830_18510 [Mesorhizobium sp. NBSH29]QPC89077.1 hypothetical protein GA830_19890 [Mesorhizobium sp. NBSH29]